MPLFRILALTIVGLTLWGVPNIANAGQETPALKGFSDEEIQGLLNGEGMGVAKVAELNHYPGPRHVLDLENQLHLSTTLRAETQKIFDKMHEEAVRLGELIIEKEQELENLFAGNVIDSNKWKTLVREISRLQGELRLTHLQAHLAMKNILSPEQIKNYDLLRGYGPNTWEMPPHHHRAPSLPK